MQKIPTMETKLVLLLAAATSRTLRRPFHFPSFRAVAAKALPSISSLIVSLIAGETRPTNVNSKPPSNPQHQPIPSMALAYHFGSSGAGMVTNAARTPKTSPIKGRPTNAKDALLHWCYMKTRNYDNVYVENFSASWSDGLAFCAMLHHFFPNEIDYAKLSSQSKRENFDLAFKVAEQKAKVYPLLETDDMIKMGDKPDWKCVYTYVQALYRGLKPFDPTQK